MKSSLKLLAFCLLVFCVIEQSYRVYAAGWSAFDPVRFASFNQLLLTDMVEASPYPDVYYQLKPGLNSWFRGLPFSTNSAGLADQEYVLEKGDDVIRVAVLGSSWTMATGVPQDAAYHAVLERRLNELYPDKRFEFINFAVEMYGLREIVGTARNRTARWQPDLLLAAVTTYTSYLKWEQPAPDQALPKPSNPLFQSYVLRAIDARLGLGIFPRSIAERPTVGTDMALSKQQVVRAIHEIGEIADAQGIPAVVMWLTFSRPNAEFETMMVRASEESGVHYAPAYKWLSGGQADSKRQQVSRLDKHPNAESHEAVAGGLLAELRNKNLLIGVK